jgi:hypothetical protein
MATNALDQSVHTEYWNDFPSCRIAVKTSFAVVPISDQVAHEEQKKQDHSERKCSSRLLLPRDRVVEEKGHSSTGGSGSSSGP